MPEFILLFVSLIIISTIFWIFKFPIENMKLILWFIFLITLINLVSKIPYLSAPFVISKISKIDIIIDLINSWNHWSKSKNKTIYELWFWDWRIIRKIALNKNNKTIGYDSKLINFINYIKWEKNLPQIKYWNIWKQDYKNADIIICYLTSKAMKEFKNKIWNNLKKWTCVISSSFKMKWVNYSIEKWAVYLYIKS